jgi:hypothetical protein
MAAFDESCRRCGHGLESLTAPKLSGHPAVKAVYDLLPAAREAWYRSRCQGSDLTGRGWPNDCPYRTNGNFAKPPLKSLEEEVGVALVVRVTRTEGTVSSA